MRTREKDQTSQGGQEFKCGPDRLEMPVRLPNGNDHHVYRQMQLRCKLSTWDTAHLWDSSTVQ